MMPFPATEWQFYQALLPGIAEEFIYRGVILAYLDAHLGRSYKCLGVNWGWGAVLTTALFYFGHALGFDADWNLQIDLFAIPDFLFYGLAMCWLRYRFKSFWPAALAHNIHNTLLPYGTNWVLSLLKTQ